MTRKYNRTKLTVNWNQIMYKLDAPIIYEPDAEVHSCEPLMNENRLRDLDSEPQLFLFKDLENEKWTMKIGFEFVRIGFCPFCGAKL